MITLIRPLPAGNAIQVYMQPPSGAVQWRLLRKTEDTFTGHDDAGAVLIRETEDDRYLIDVTALVNGTEYFYRLYSLVDSVWLASATVSATPAASYQDAHADAMSVVRERLELGLKVELVRGTIHHKRNAVGVLTAPPIFEDTVFPVVTVHLQNSGSSERGIGEIVTPEFMLDGDIVDGEGWLSRVQLLIIVWALNPDERIALRKAVRRIIQANLPVFDEAGMIQIDVSFSDTEDFETYGAPVYQTSCQFSCMVAEEVVTGEEASITDVVVGLQDETRIGLYCVGGSLMADGVTLRMMMSMPPSSDDPAEGFTVRVNGVDTAIVSASIDGNYVILVLATAVYAGQIVRVSYNSDIGTITG